MPLFRLNLGTFQHSPGDPIEHTMRTLERQGSMLVRVAHIFATLMIVLFSLGSLVALSGDAVTEIATSLLHGGIPSIPKAISVVVSTLLVVCCVWGWSTPPWSSAPCARAGQSMDTPCMWRCSSRSP